MKLVSSTGSGVAALPQGGAVCSGDRAEQRDSRTVRAALLQRGGQDFCLFGGAFGSVEWSGSPGAVSAVCVMRFSGSMRLRIGEAVHLQPTCTATRHAALFGKVAQSLDPYIVVKVDEYRVGQTRTKHRTNSPTYNEEFSAGVTTGTTLELAVFHDAPIGYDQFIANCTIRFQDLMEATSTEEIFEGWVDLEPEGKVYIVIAPQRIFH
ncbi:hypothetical protein MHYP_G00047230 [Metynnis hypsauchen]